MQHDEDVLSTEKLPLHKQEGFWLAAVLGAIGLLIPFGLMFFGPKIEGLLQAL